jgi:hypothetical protein
VTAFDIASTVEARLTSEWLRESDLTLSPRRIFEDGKYSERKMPMLPPKTDLNDHRKDADDVQNS